MIMRCLNSIKACRDNAVNVADVKKKGNLALPHKDDDIDGAAFPRKKNPTCKCFLAEARAMG